jgi:transcriptional regulator with XRE-family HTH domain
MAANKLAELNPTDKHVGTRIRMRRMMLGMSQTTLGNAVDVTFQQIQKYEKGVNRVSASRMQQFAQILHVPVSFFFEDAPVANIFGIKSRETLPGMPAYIQEFITIRDGLSIIEAFSRIRNPKLRRAVVALVEQIAGDDKRRGD